MNGSPSALIADDEPLLRQELEKLLAKAWPELNIVATVRNGREAVEQFEKLSPDICFLDVRMPGLSGVEAARRIGARAHIVFVTAYDSYAVEAFAQGVVDYLVKPIARERLAETVMRLQSRLASSRPSPPSESLLQQLAAYLHERQAPGPLRWLRASTGTTLRMIAVESVDFLRSDEKYTCVGWRDESGAPAEAMIRTALKDLLEQLDPHQFVQSHRSVVVALRAIRHVTRGENETATIHLIGRPEVLPVSRKHFHHFRQM
ncbi:LytTR family DNA-binding domain-containing protein [Pseudoxanthomonas sp. CF125]|uniref:LytR/AlgR family response regulator transcription factor n=1 Tax=Pseudoxanthomonas sp. CF125 TaxID=1855303 RepID=UPI0008832030|nr:LytTR family DNA-binding domain-containing protein [Pseudoxanthomonas sp. CF125]SDQ81682.1 two component transcriptional regulator, LytTR family [Pseudoxanthomonas sp. CF125]